MKKLTVGVLVVSAVLAGSALAQNFGSQNLIKGGDESFTLNLGGIFNQFGTTVRLDGQTSRGSDIDLERGGLDNQLSSFEASGTWRFLSRHRIDMLYFGAKRSGSHVTDRELDIDGQVIPVNFTLAAEAKSQFVLADYRYSFVKTPAVEVAGVLGIFGGNFKYRLSGTGTRQGQPVTLDVSESTTVPLPLIGASLDWYINPRWKVSANVAGIAAHIGDYDGSAIVAGAATEYMLTRNFGLGVAYMYTDVKVDVTKSSFDGNITWKMNSARAYAQFKY